MHTTGDGGEIMMIVKGDGVWNDIVLLLPLIILHFADEKKQNIFFIIMNFEH